MNYFNYFTEIEDTFVRRRAKTLLLSPVDWALIESWKARGVPLHVALNAITKTFDSHEKSNRKRSVKTLMYCAEEVEAQFAEWSESQVGSTAIETANGNGAKPRDETKPHREATNESLPFPPEAIAAHLSNAGDELRLMRETNQGGQDFTETLMRAISRLEDIKTNWQAMKRRTVASVERLEAALSEIEKMLDAALPSRLSSDELAAHRGIVKEHLAPYAKRMPKDVYQATFDNLLHKRLREHFRVPRLSLFYL